MVRKLAKKLSTLEDFSGDVIAEIKFIRGEFESGVKVLKVTRELKLVLAASAEEKILVKLVTPRRKIRAALGTRIQSEKKTWRTFTAQEVFEFVEEVGDRNEIHRLNPPIVPGLLILESILEVERFSSCEEIKLRFKHFITAGEPLSLLEKEENLFEIQSAGSLKVLISTV